MKPIARPYLCQLWGRRLTNRCSEPGPIKCLAAGVDTLSASHFPRARVLTGQLAVAELSRWATLRSACAET